MIYTKRVEKIWQSYLFQQYQRPWQCFPLVLEARGVQQQLGFIWREKLLVRIWKCLETLFSCTTCPAVGLQPVGLPLLMVQRGKTQKNFPLEGQEEMAGQMEAVTPRRFWSQEVLFSAILLPAVWDLWKHNTTHTWGKIIRSKLLILRLS